MSINNWPKGDRPREKLFKNGEHTLTDSELLAIILRTGFGKKGFAEVQEFPRYGAAGFRPVEKIKRFGRG
jgi:hypothetical protein